MKGEILWLQNILNTFPDIVVIHDSDQKLVMSNTSYKDEFSKLRKEIENTDYPETVLLTKTQFDAVLERNEPVSNTIAIHRPHSYLTHIYQTNLQLTSPLSQEKFVLSIYRDVSLLKRQENALIQANQMVSLAKESRSRFLAIMTHELRTPIAGTMGLLEMLKSHISSKEGHLLLGAVNSSTHNLQLLVNDILDFSKIDARQLKLDICKTNIIKAIGEILRLHQSSAYEKDLAFDVEWNPSPIQYINIDRLRFSQILNNLLSNAVKFTNQGRISVKIKLTETVLALEISDTGIGIEKSQMENIFTPFEQADGTIARTYGGTGLGLSIVKSLVEMMNGDLILESEPGEGTAVNMVLPVDGSQCFQMDHARAVSFDEGLDPHIQHWLRVWGYQAPSSGIRNLVAMCQDGSGCCRGSQCIEFVPDIRGYRRQILDGHIQIAKSPFYPDIVIEAIDEFYQGQVVAEETEGRRLKGSVLVAEDNPINQLLLEKQLSKIGVCFNIVDDGAIAYEEIKNNPYKYDVVLSDYHMPNMDGYKLAQKIKTEIPQARSIRVIGVTAEYSKEVANCVHESGFDRILHKPYRICDLFEALDANLPRHAVSGCEVSVDLDWLHKHPVDDGLELAKLFVEAMRSDTQILETCMEARDFNQLAKTLHRIKGGLSTIGVPEIPGDVRKIESMLKKDEKPESIIHDGLLLLKKIVSLVKKVEHWEKNVTNNNILN